MDDDGGQSGIGDIEEDGGESVDGEKDNEASDDACEGSSNAGLGFDSCPREGTGGRVGTKEGAKYLQKSTVQSCSTIL